MKRRKKEEPHVSSISAPMLHATAGAIAGCISRFVVGPLDVLKIRFQVQLEPISSRCAPGSGAIPRSSKYTGMGQALVTIFREEGVKVSYCF